MELFRIIGFSMVQLCLELELGVTPRLSETISPVVNLAAAVQKMTADYAD